MGEKMIDRINKLIKRFNRISPKALIINALFFIGLCYIAYAIANMDLTYLKETTTVKEVDLPVNGMIYLIFIGAFDKVWHAIIFFSCGLWVGKKYRRLRT
jgi:hypothetical protein